MGPELEVEASRMLRVILIDDHNLVRDGIKAILTAQPDVTVVAEAATAREGFAAVQSCRCDLVIVDFNLPDEEGTWVVLQIRRVFPRLPVLLLSQYTDPEKVRYAMDCGCHGYVVKSAPQRDLLAAVQLVGAGGIYVHPAVAEACLGRRESREEFKTRDLTMLRLLATGLSNQQMSTRLNVSVGTVKRDLAQLFARLGVSDRTELVAEAVARGLVERTP